MATLKDLKFDDKNFNKHTQFGMSLIEKSLRENGAGRSILLDKDNNIIAGNGVVESASQIGLEKIKIVETTGDEIVAVKRTDVSLNSKKGREMALADNATASADLEWDRENLQAEFDDEEIEGWGVDTADWQEETGEIIEDEAPEVNESEPADSELGKVYKLGEHRLMCGDSTDAGSVAILMDGQKADMVFTDPPYNVAMSRSKVDGSDNSIKNDNLSQNDFARLLDGALTNAINNCNTKNMYWWIGFRQYSTLENLFIKNNITIANCIVWDKGSIGLGGGGYRYQHELCIFSGRTNNNTVSDVWQFKRDSSGLHPTMKPVYLVAKAIENIDNVSTILDLFCGSGSTLIACEQLGRKCYMMELDPKYCDVIRKRYWKFKTGSEEGWQDGTRAIAG